MLNRLLLIAACLPLASCASNSADVRRVPPPASLTVSCDDPVQLPGRAMTDQEVEVAWGRDRSALRACASRHGALSNWATGPR